MARETAHLFNSAIGAAALSAAYELGLLEALKNLETVNLDDFCEKHGLHLPSARAIVHVLHCLQILERESGTQTIKQGVLFEDAFKDKGYFLWLVGGYGNMLQNISQIAKTDNRTGTFVTRNGRCVAMASRDYGSQFVDPHFEDMIQQMPHKIAVDLGCGSGERLMSLAKGDPEFQGIGIDINEDVVRLAQRNVDSQNLDGQIKVIHADVRELKPLPEFADAEVMMCFFMGHDLWPREQCLEAFKRIGEAFPRAKRFLFCDTYRSDLPVGWEVPIFTSGFELTHALMGQYVPSVSEWMQLFNEADWRCSEVRNVGIPYSSIFDLRKA